MTLFLRSFLPLVALVFTGFSQQPSPSPAPPLAHIKVTVIAEAGGKPVKNAEIVLHMLDKSGNQKQEGLELKTHDDGKAETSGFPYGKVRIQVIARRFRTYGEDYDVNQPNLEIVIKLQKPKDQFSIYK
jgi:uncharacterized GH25 family protein